MMGKISSQKQLERLYSFLPKSVNVYLRYFVRANPAVEISQVSDKIYAEVRNNNLLERDVNALFALFGTGAEKVLLGNLTYVKREDNATVVDCLPIRKLVYERQE